jgi:septum formation protein
MPLWLADEPLVLASRSDARGKILAAAGLRFEIRPAQLDERSIEERLGSLGAGAVAQLLARKKAQSVEASLPGRLVLGADQTLTCGGRRFDKPADRAAAAAQLRALRGRTHMLHSALALTHDGAVLFECLESAELTMRNFSDAFLDDYLDMMGAAAEASVGAYQLEGIGVHLFERVGGNYFTILGLPLLPLLDFLRREGFAAG